MFYACLKCTKNDPEQYSPFHISQKAVYSEISGDIIMESVKKRKFGVLSDGTKVNLYTVSNGELTFSASDYGATLTSIIVPSKKHGKADVLLFPSTFDGAVRCNSWFGALVGRFANRISGASFSLDGSKYTLTANEGANCLHSGYPKYCKMMWEADAVETPNAVGIRFKRTSPDGEQGFPGNVQFEVLYLLSAHNELTMRYRAETDQVTPINITNHAYFNLAGSGTILNHTAQIASDSVLEIDDCTIPTGQYISVAGTPFDFKEPHQIGERISDAALQKTRGYDHCFVLDNKGKVRKFAVFTDPVSGRTMSCATNQPGFQLYTGNFLDNAEGRDGQLYGAYSGFCVETQQFPDAPNKPDFPSCIVRPGESYDAITTFSFTW